MARAERIEQHPATGTTLVVMVGLGIAFLLFIAFLNVVKSGNILSEANLLYAALVFYAGAGALYLGFGVTGTEAYIRFASLMTWAGLLANTGAVAHRWYEAGHPPFASIFIPILIVPRCVLRGIQDMADSLWSRLTYENRYTDSAIEVN